MFLFLRESDRWGSICFYAKQCFVVNTVNIKPNCSTFEHAELNISVDGFQLLACACYRPPKGSLENCNDEPELYLNTINAFNNSNCRTFRLLVKHICPSALTCTGLRSGDRSRDRLYINV